MQLVKCQTLGFSLGCDLGLVRLTSVSGSSEEGLPTQFGVQNLLMTVSPINKDEIPPFS